MRLGFLEKGKYSALLYLFVVEVLKIAGVVNFFLRLGIPNPTCKKFLLLPQTYYSQHTLPAPLNACPVEWITHSTGEKLFILGVLCGK